MSVSIDTNTGQLHPQHPMQVAQQHRPAQPGPQQQPQAVQQEHQYQHIHPQTQAQTPQEHPSLEPVSLPPSGLDLSPQLSSAVQLSPTVGVAQQPGPQGQSSPGPSEQQLKDLEQHIKSVYGAYGTVYVNILPSPVAAPQKMSADNLDVAPMPTNLNDMTDINLDPPGGGFNLSSSPVSEPAYDGSSCYSPRGYSPAQSPSSSPYQRHVQAFLEHVEEMPLHTHIPHLPFSDSAPLLSSPLMKEHSNSSFLSNSPCHSPSRSPRAMSIADLSLDASIEDTGISAEEVSSYISPQDPITHRWTCMFPECNKTFGRRENIRSHVQTHLGDRQYRCNACGKCFVRQHDLKRHSKIHTGDKPYRCPCGGGFARQDALTRHRQRGMCVGGFPGAVRSGKARGRPRKKRPDMEDRLDKAQRTRRAAAPRFNYAASLSGGSVSDESAMSPIQDFNSFDSAPLAELGSDPPSDPFRYVNISSIRAR
jgi:regulatory protein SWI5